MQPPTRDDVAAYAVSLGYGSFDADHFLDHHEMTGWVYGKNRVPIKSWKAAVRTWHRNDRIYAGQRRADPSQADQGVIKDYAIQLRKMRAGRATGDDIHRFYCKVRDAVGPGGVEAVKAIA